MTEYSGHKNTVREEFTKQATAYATNASVRDPDRIARLVRATSPSADARVLDVATGPGYVALGFAEQCDVVVGMDLTGAPLQIAEETRQEREVTNAQFQKGDAEKLPFESGTFDIVVCRLAWHHLERPARVLQEMTRVCRPGGTVAVEDLVVSEHPERGDYQNEFERHRDPSHVCALPISRLLELFARAGLEVEHVHTDRNVENVEDWIDNAQPTEDSATRARTMIERDRREDLSGTRPFRRDGTLYFTQQIAVLVGSLIP